MKLMSLHRSYNKACFLRRISVTKLSRSWTIDNRLLIENVQNFPLFCTWPQSESLKFDTEKDSLKKSVNRGPSLEYFIANLENRQISSREVKKISHPYVNIEDLDGDGQKVYFKVYGCQMNSNDTEVAWSILKTYGYSLTQSFEEADIVFLVTCAIREGAESKIWKQLAHMRKIKETRRDLKVGVLGCMAERIGPQIIEKEKAVDVIAGPDSYKDLPRLLALSKEGERTVNILLSHDETYASVKPVSLKPDRISAYVSIMRGCNNMCTYCIVPYTRGRERSRNFDSILDEIRYLSDEGVKEVVLLGQNVNSYNDTSTVSHAASNREPSQKFLAKGFQTIYKNGHYGRRFSDLLDKVSLIDPELRIRFTSPHPKDFPDDVLHIIKERDNICNNIHLPVQCGSTKILESMGRGYSREAYIELVKQIRSIISDVSISSDFICGFCGESEEDFEETLSLMKIVRYNYCFMFPFSMREKTGAHRKLKDDVPHNVKIDRLKRMNSLFRDIALRTNTSKIGERHLVLVEGPSRRSPLQLCGRNDGNTKVILPNVPLPVLGSTTTQRNAKPGDYVEVIISDANSQTLKGIPASITSIKDFYSCQNLSIV